jgi:hypothetical protein
LAFAFLPSFPSSISSDDVEAESRAERSHSIEEWLHIAEITTP